MAIPDNVESRQVKITLFETRYSAWIETEQSKITRIFIRAPEPLSGLWASHGREAFNLTNVFRFLSAIIDIKIFSNFFESASVVALTVRKWVDERDNGLPKVHPADLEPILKTWLASKSFGTDDDLIRLTEAGGGSLIYGILVLSLTLNDKKHENRNFTQRIPGSKVMGRNVIPPEILVSVRSLWTEVSSQNQTQTPHASFEEQTDDVA